MQVICEPSGGYERALVRAVVACAAKNQFGPSQPGAAICPSKGYLGQDRSHRCEVLCAFAEAMQPGTISASELEQEQLRELESQRRHLTHLLVMEQNRAARMSDLWVCKLNRRLITQIKKQIEQLDLLIQRQIEASPELSQSRKIDGDQRSRYTHGRVAPGADAGAWATEPPASRRAGRSSTV